MQSIDSMPTRSNRVANLSISPTDFRQYGAFKRVELMTVIRSSNLFIKSFELLPKETWITSLVSLGVFIRKSLYLLISLVTIVIE